jgi:hypothetical protein
LDAGVPAILDPVDLVNSISEAQGLMNNESIQAGPASVPDPRAQALSAITDSNLAALRAKFPFLREFSDVSSRLTSQTA